MDNLLRRTRRFLLVPISDTFKRLRNFLTFSHSFLYKSVKAAVKGLLHKVRSTTFYLLRPGKPSSSQPLLPIQNPASSSTFETKPSTSAYSADFSDTNDAQSDDLQFHDIYVSEADQTTDRDHHDPVPVISVPDSTRDLHACSTNNNNASVDPINNVPYLEERQEEKEVVIIKKKKSSVVVVNEEIKRITHYNSRQRILLVGEGDFSFSACLARSFVFASNMVSTSLDSKRFLKKHYKNAVSNIAELSRRGCMVMHGIDATVMVDHEILGGLKFDRIVYNFPFAGFFKGLSRESTLRSSSFICIVYRSRNMYVTGADRGLQNRGCHRRLVSLFMKNAKEMLSENGEIHISHKTNGFHLEWKLVSMASSHGLRLIEAVEFDLHHYPGYNTKRGFGGDDNFDCYPSSTYKFGLKKC
ncbi:hypothetical protein OROGR_003486 [Orobanche gracilis]